MALLQSYSPGTIKQYAADDISAPAQEQRQWWNSFKTAQASAQKAAETAPMPKQHPMPKQQFDVLKAVKSPEIAGAGKSLMSDFNTNKEAGNKGFADYLAQANELNAQAKQDLTTDRNALDTTAFSKTLADLRSKQEANLLAQRDDTIKYAAGDRERALATSGLPSGASSDMENRAISAYLSASLPVSQKILEQRAQDAEMLQKLNMSTVGQRGSLSGAYLNRLLAPEQARTSLLNSQIGSLGALQGLDERNTFYGLQTPYNNNAPILPINRVNGQSYVPPVRNLPPLDYGLLNRTQLQGSGGVGRNVNQAPRSQAEEGYKRDTGFYPQDDPNFNTMLYESYGGRIGQPRRPAFDNETQSSPQTSELPASRAPFVENLNRGFYDLYTSPTDRGQFGQEDYYFNNP